MKRPRKKGAEVVSLDDVRFLREREAHIAEINEIHDLLGPVLDRDPAYQVRAALHLVTAAVATAERQVREKHPDDRSLWRTPDDVLDGMRFAWRSIDLLERLVRVYPLDPAGWLRADEEKHRERRNARRRELRAQKREASQ